MEAATRAALALKAMPPETCVEGIRQHSIAEHAHKIVQGWYLMHAQLAFALPPEDRGQGRNSSATVALDYANAEKEGFEAWLEEHCTGLISRRTAYNYLTAATRAGLTLEMTPEAALEKAQAALAGVARLKDLYSLPSSGEDEPPPPGATGTAPVIQLWLDFGAHLDQLTAEESKEVRALYSMELTALKGLEERTRRALDVIKTAAEAVKKGSRK